MKILLGCSNKLDAGAGIAVYVQELANELLRMGLEVHITSPIPFREEWLSEMQIHHLSYDEACNQLESARYLMHYVHEHKIDGIINNDNSLLQSIAPGVTCPFISVGHFGSTVIAAVACYQWQWCDYVVAISSDMQKRFVQKFGVSVTRCPIIHNGVRDKGHDGCYHRNDSSTLRVMYAGGANPYKGADIVLRTVLKDPALWTNIRLDWFGVSNSKMAPRISGLAYVHPHGYVPHDELLANLRNTDILLFPSREEGCPMALLEAMSMGVVPIASDGEGAMRWLIENRQNGFICNLKNWDSQLMECLEYLRDNPLTLESMKRSARARFLREFEIAMTAERLLMLLRQPVVDRSSRPESLNILRWHRPLKPSLEDRVRFRLGWLQSAGILRNTVVS